MHPSSHAHVIQAVEHGATAQQPMQTSQYPMQHHSSYAYPCASGAYSQEYSQAVPSVNTSVPVSTAAGANVSISETLKNIRRMLEYAPAAVPAASSVFDVTEEKISSTKSYLSNLMRPVSAE